MKKKSQMIHGLVLLLILSGGAFTFWYATGNTKLQLLAGIVTSAAYVAWGIIHHALEGDLHPKVVIEYVLIGLIAIVLLLTLAL
jgi:hypothetical protein